jgi:hypothetical protein
VINSPHWLPSPPATAPACPACAYPPSKLADELGSPVILTPAAREVAIQWRRPPRPEVRVLRLDRH